MLTLHTSNQLEDLNNQFSVLASSPLSNVFSPEAVVVQNASMGRYLSMQVADAAGISANMEFLFPAEFMWKLLRIVSPDISEQSQCSPDTLRFHIMKELIDHHERYPELHHYIEHNKKIDHVAAWELSCELSNTLDQYLFYRSDWIRKWEKHPEKKHSENWQARLWLRCVKDKQLIHWLALQDQFKHSLNKIDTAALPKRISFFSMSALSPGYLDLLGELAQKTDVHLFIMNPCENIYWGDIHSEKSIAKLPLDKQIYSEIGNPLLASLGKQGRDFIHQLLNLPDPEIIPSPSRDAKSKPVSNCVLKQLQNDIFHLKHPKRIPNYNPQKDNSIRFNACHTAMREVEVLHDQILDALDSDDSLSPSDIVVMLPDIEKYAPYIEAVFSTRIFSDSTRKLPFSIADRNPLIIHTMIESLLSVLKLPDTRFDVESVFKILDDENIRNHFNLNEAHLSQCRKLAKATNIRWGISANTRLQNNLPGTEEHTWKYALDRLLLGFTLGNNKVEQLFPADRALNLLPFTDIEGSDAVMLADFKRFTDIIFSIQDWHHQNHTLNNWLDKFNTLMFQLYSDEQKNIDLSKIVMSISQLKNNTRLTEFNHHIPFAVFQKILTSSLQDIAAPEKFLGHGITFCALIPMRSVPFKLIALMGMNDGEFPRQDKHYSFDLMANQPRRGDRSRRDEDRYLFLESLLAVRSRLIISYIGQSVKDNSDLPPSIVVSELLDVLNSYTGISTEDWICKHPLQAFSPRYFLGENKLFSYAQTYASLHKSSERPSPIFIKERLPELENSYKDIQLNDLINFFQSPARFFLKTRFAIQTFDEDVTLPIREPFELESFKDREIRSLLLEAAPENHAILLARAKGLLPYGDIGDNIFNQEQLLMENFKAKLPQTDDKEPLTFSMELNGIVLHGELDKLTTKGRIVEQVSKPYFREYLDIWITHLMLNALPLKEPEKYSLLYSPELSFRLMPVDNAREMLEELVNYYWQGLHLPLMFFPKAALAMYQDKGVENKKRAIDIWHGNSLRAGEKDKFENWLLYRSLEMTDDTNIPDEFLNVSQLIFRNMYSSLEVI